MVGTAGRRLLSHLCFHFSFEVISFYSIFYIMCFLKTGRGLSSRREGIRRFCSQGLIIGHLHLWRHFTAMTRIIQSFAFLCKLGLHCYLRCSKTGSKKRPTCFATFLKTESWIAMMGVLPLNARNKVERFWFVGGKTRNIVAIQLVLQQWRKTSCTFFFTVLPYL